MTAGDGDRSGSFGEHRPPSAADRLGRWLSIRKLSDAVGSVTGLDVADVGCGFDAKLSSELFARARTVHLFDLAIGPTPWSDRVITHPGSLPESLAELGDGSLDVVLCNNVLEHLWEPERALGEFHRVLRPGGRLALNVPSWYGKRALEFAAFRLGVSPEEEMQDHKMYYDPRDLWPMLVRAGFRPKDVSVARHKLLLNTLAVATR